MRVKRMVARTLARPLLAHLLLWAIVGVVTAGGIGLVVAVV